MKIPLVADIKRNALDDGPGIRSVVFFKGCPLRCSWCHNPEAMDHHAELMFRPATCIDCRDCVGACPTDAIGTTGPMSLDRNACDGCGRCTEECPSGALEMVGARYPVERLAQLLLRDRQFYENSGGGVTLSGGEPVLYTEYVGALAARLKAEDVHVMIETSGDFGWDRFARHLLPHLDLIYVDLKIFDSEQHQRHCGRDNRRILETIRKLVGSDVETLVRVPLIPDITATETNLRAIGGFLEGIGQHRVGVIPYNPLWMNKARGLGRKLSFERDAWLSDAERQDCRRALGKLEIIGDL